MTKPNLEVKPRESVTRKSVCSEKTLDNGLIPSGLYISLTNPFK